MKFRNFTLVLTLLVMLSAIPFVYAQEVQRGSGIAANCGDVIEGEFTSNYQEETYKIELKAGDSFQVSVMPLGGQLNTGILVTGPTNLGVIASNGGVLQVKSVYRLRLAPQPNIDTGVLSASGNYTIRLINFNAGTWGTVYEYASDEYQGLSSSGGIGAYTLSIGCTLRDSTVINPGDTAPAPNQNGGNTNVVLPTFSGTGFPGLAPVDFTGLNPKTLTSSKSVIGAVDGNAITSYTIDAAANDILALEFTRASGNLNLGLVVLSSDNKVVFQASLVTSSELTTKFTLPTAGTYTIGIFRIDLLPPAAPEATAFQLTATLNP